MKKLQRQLIRLTNYLLAKWYRLALLILLLVILLPIFTNSLMFTSIPFLPADQNNVWIDFFGGFFGSIIGELLTLIGIYLTIKKEHYTKVLADFGTKVRKIDEIYDNLDLFLIDGFTSLENPADHVQMVDFQDKTPKLIMQGLSQVKVLASEVDANVYYEIVELHNNLIDTFTTHYEKVNSEVFNDVFLGNDVEKNNQKFKKAYSDIHPNLWFDVINVFDECKRSIVTIRESLEEEYWDAYELLQTNRKRISRQ